MTAERPAEKQSGSMRPSAFQQKIRRIGAALPDNYVGRKAASLLLGPAGGRARQAYDVEIFGGQKARLHPYDNISEKRVYLTPQFWEREERARLAALIAARAGKPFRFVDVGANAGLYTLFARAEAIAHGCAFRAVAIEADSDMAARLAFNVEASGAADEVRLFRCAASSVDGMLKFSVNTGNRGESRVAADGARLVPARPILAMIIEAGLDGVDAMKIDIEGHEEEALAPYFRDSPAAFAPRLLILETSHQGASGGAERLAIAAGWRAALHTARNIVLIRDD